MELFVLIIIGGVLWWIADSLDEIKNMKKGIIEKKGTPWKYLTNIHYNGKK